MRALHPFFSISICALTLISCGGSVSKDRPDGKLSVFVSIPPQASFVKAIGGERVVVTSFAGEGQDPHQISVQPKQMSALAKAHVYFSVGMPFEQLLVEKISGQKNAPEIVDTTKGVKLIAFEEGAHGHGDDHAHDHDHGENDPHIWLAPEKIKAQAETIAATLKRIAPEHSAEFDKNLATFVETLDQLDRSISDQMEPFLGETFFVYHAAFGYFANAYGLYQEPVETGGQSPTPKALTKFIDHAKEEGAKVIFVQPQFDQRNAETVAKEIGGKVVPLDPLAEDVLGNLKIIADSISTALSNQ
ncbi:MAG: zinc transport system substrate-binding protein [Verrucomicrobiales bacterium]|jgi:zinc transport system substrate-binding protein